MAKPSPEKQATEPDNKSKRPKKRNWRRRFTLLSAILLVLGWLANGPFARWAIHYGVEESMDALGMNGSVTVKGSVISGLSLHDLNYRGNEGIESLTIKQLDLEYQIRELFDGKIRGLDLQTVKLVIDYARFPKSEEPQTNDPSELRKTLTQLRPYLTSPRMTLSNVDITLLNEGEKSASFKLKTLSHDRGSGVYQFIHFQASNAQNQTTPLQNTQLTWHPLSATIDRLEILPEVALEKGHFDWSNTLQGNAKLLLGNAALELKLTDTLDIQLTDGELHSAFLTEKFALELPASFTIDTLHTHLEEWNQAIPSWKLTGKLNLKSFDIDDYSLRDTAIEFSQKDTIYKILFNGKINSAHIQATANGSWTTPSTDEWWSDTKLQYTLKASQLTSLASPWLSKVQGVDLKSARINLKGSIELKDTELNQATLTGISEGLEANDISLPQLHWDAHYKQDGSIHASVHNNRTATSHFAFKGQYNLKHQSYQGELKLSEPDPAWLNALSHAFDAPVTLGKDLQLEWKGQGNVDFNQPQTGYINVKKLTFSTPDNPSFQITGKADYDWPKSLHVQNLAVTEGDWQAKAKLQWDGKTLALQTASLTNQHKTVAHLTGKTPFNAKIKDLAHFFKQRQPWELHLKSQPLALKKLSEWFTFDITEGITGSASANLKISGSPASPTINGDAHLTDIKGLDAAQREPIHAAITFHSTDKQLEATTSLIERKTKLLDGNITLPLKPIELLLNPEEAKKWLHSAQLDGKASIHTLPLERFSRFIPQLEKIQGHVTGTAKLFGTLSKPRYTLDLNAKAPLIRLRQSDLGDIRDVVLDATIDENQKIKTTLTAKINGGKFEVSGTADIADTEQPQFDLSVTTRYALVHRDDLLSVRANTDLRIRGNLDDATISGNIGIVESLFYKDMELIPIGVPTSEVAKVQLPALDPEKAANELPVPEPFNRWKLDVNITTTDPILIRGNVASGSVRGSLRVGGTLSAPRPNGTLIAENVRAKLPFSILNVKRGEIRFTPDKGLNPTLNVRGKSTVGSHDVTVFVYGSASSPKTTLTSYPPLPESEIMSLLGTGTTTSGLEDRDVATFKAFQVFLMKLKKRASKPGGNKLFKNLLEGVDDLNLNVGEKDRFTGRKFSSATIEMHPRWHLTAQVDAQQQTRGLIVYVIRFR